MQIEVDPAKGTRIIALAKNDGDVLVQRDSMAQLGAAAFVSLNGFVHQRDERRLEFFGGLVDTDNVSLVRLERVRYLSLEGFDRHASHSTIVKAEVKPKMGPVLSIGVFPEANSSQSGRKSLDFPRFIRLPSVPKSVMKPIWAALPKFDAGRV
jgi:hypothetical protein